MPSTNPHESFAYLRTLFPEPSGFIHLAVRDPEANRWVSFPAYRSGYHHCAGRSHAETLAGIARGAAEAARAGLDVYVCPYPLEGLSRHKGSAVVRRFIHVDVDGGVDLEQVRAIGAFAVASGSVAIDGRPHAHLYLPLTESVDAATHTKLCRGLARMFPGADFSKVSDNDLLRLPGTLNWKSWRPSSVRFLVAPGGAK